MFMDYLTCIIAATLVAPPSSIPLKWRDKYCKLSNLLCDFWVFMKLCILWVDR